MAEITNVGTFSYYTNDEQVDFVGECTVNSKTSIKDLIQVSKACSNDEPVVGDVVTYTFTIVIGDVQETCNHQAFKDTPDSGAKFVAGSVVVNGEAQPDLDLSYFATEFEPNSTNTIVYQCEIVA